jgi:hypothetical protein
MRQETLLFPVEGRQASVWHKKTSKGFPLVHRDLFINEFAGL